MIEIPEAATLSRQMAEALAGRSVCGVTAGATPHRFAWFYSDREELEAFAVGRRVSGGKAVAGFARLDLGDRSFLFSEGMRVLLHREGEPRPAKHQLLVEFDDGSALSSSAQMYGGVGLVNPETFDNPFFRHSAEKPSPLGDDFTWEYFLAIAEAATPSLSAKGLLATEQRIPGLGNGALQDILFRARVHPKRKVQTMAEAELRAIYDAVKDRLRLMTAAGGRDTELDLFGNPGGYTTLMSRGTVGKPCPECGTPVEKLAYMGGSVYVCPGCQVL